MINENENYCDICECDPCDCGWGSYIIPFEEKLFSLRRSYEKKQKKRCFT